jgi:hypothetical protein
MDNDDYPEGNITKEQYIVISNWTGEDATRAASQWLENGKPDWLRGPSSQWNSINNIKTCKKQYLDGDKGAALYALHLCMLDNLPPPKWVQKAFIQAYQTINSYNAKSWDEVFGRPYPKNTQLKARQKRRELSASVYHRISHKLSENPNIPIDEFLFQTVADELNLYKTQVSEYYYFHVKKYGMKAKRNKKNG